MAREKILVVDDELFVRELLLEFLGKQGFEVLLAESGEKALEVAKTTPVQIALIDLKMPGLDGIQTLKELKKITPEILPIIMTGYPTIESAVEALRSGACDYVIKPFKLNELRASIDRVLKEHQLKYEIDELKGKIKGLEEELKKYQKGNRNPDPFKFNHGSGVTPIAGGVMYAREQKPVDSVIIEQIKKLGELKEKGLISDKEYELKKGELLERR
ncbi:MAG: response regulator [candidate division Zixibacteria bacterium]|nr:response regulator [candidate division Zixibacteria bacterium]